MTTKNCIIVPIHPPKSNWLVAMLTSLQLRYKGTRSDVDVGRYGTARVILAVSNFGDLVFFERLLQALQIGEGVEFFCVDSYILDTLRSPTLLKRFQENQDGCVVNLKKLLALQWAAAKGFDAAVCIDTDTIVIGDLSDLFSTQAENYAKRMYLGVSGQSGLFQDINKAVIGAFPEEDRNNIDLKLQNSSWYMWFFDIPFYDLSDFSRFLNHMSEPHGSVTAWLSSLTHYTFEHLLFSFWRLMHETCAAVDYRELGIDRLPENLTAYDLVRIKDAYGYCPAWINSVQLFLEPGIVRILPKLKLAYHFDRMHATSG